VATEGAERESGRKPTDRDEKTASPAWKAEPLRSRDLARSRDEQVEPKFRLAGGQQEQYPIVTTRPLRDVLQSGWYAWSKRQPSRRTKRDAVLSKPIRIAHTGSAGARH
jgi:hypothetical protein